MKTNQAEIRILEPITHGFGSGSVPQQPPRPVPHRTADRRRPEVPSGAVREAQPAGVGADYVRALGLVPDGEPHPVAHPPPLPLRRSLLRAQADPSHLPLPPPLPPSHLPLPNTASPATEFRRGFPGGGGAHGIRVQCAEFLPANQIGVSLQELRGRRVVLVAVFRWGGGFCDGDGSEYLVGRCFGGTEEGRRRV